MKKKSIIISVCAVVVVIALALSLAFVFGGTGENSADTTQENTPSLSGTWLVVANCTDDIVTFTDNQYMIFTETEAAMYKDSTGDAFAKSSYTVNEANQLVLSDISRQYKIDQKTDNFVRLYETVNTYMILVRNSTSEKKSELITTDFINGKWDVAFKGDTLNTGETLEFDGDTFKYFKNGSESPFATADFTLENNVLSVASLGINLHCFKVNDNTMIFIEETGTIWEISK